MSYEQISYIWCRYIVVKTTVSSSNFKVLKYNSCRGDLSKSNGKMVNCLNGYQAGGEGVGLTLVHCKTEVNSQYTD